jgi:hypothetical protein
MATITHDLDLPVLGAWGCARTGRAVLDRQRIAQLRVPLGR